jgi:hypothetical protein
VQLRGQTASSRVTVQTALCSPRDKDQIPKLVSRLYSGTLRSRKYDTTQKLHHVGHGKEDDNNFLFTAIHLHRN